MKLSKTIKGIIFLGFITSGPLIAFAEESTVPGTIKEGYQDAKKNVKKTYRKAKNKTCELVNGKMECKAKELKHKVENTVDEIKDKAN